MDLFVIYWLPFDLIPVPIHDGFVKRMGTNKHFPSRGIFIQSQENQVIVPRRSFAPRTNNGIDWRIDRAKRPFMN